MDRLIRWLVRRPVSYVDGYPTRGEAPLYYIGWYGPVVLFFILCVIAYMYLDYTIFGINIGAVMLFMWAFPPIPLLILVIVGLPFFMLWDKIRRAKLEVEEEE